MVELWCRCCIMMFRWIYKQPGIQNFGRKINSHYQDIYDWISPFHKPSGSWFILTQQSMGGNEHGKSGHLSIFTHMKHLKPQDSFGEFDNFFLDRSSESAGNHQKTPSDLLAIVWNDILSCSIAQWQIIIMYITYGKVFGGTPNIFMFWFFPENGSISERTVNRALIVHTTL